MDNSSGVPENKLMKRGRPIKLNDDDLRLVLSLVAERKRLLAEAGKLSDAKIAEKFDVHPNTIRRATGRA